MRSDIELLELLKEHTIKLIHEDGGLCIVCASMYNLKIITDREDSRIVFLIKNKIIRYSKGFVYGRYLFPKYALEPRIEAIDKVIAELKAEQ